MHRQRSLALALAALGLVAAPAVRAADHGDGPAVSADPASDITDLYAWVSADGAKVYLVMDVFPKATTTAKFSDTVKYVFHTNSRMPADLLKPPGAAADIVCSFDATQKISCWLVDPKAPKTTLDYVGGDASKTTGITSTSGKLKVFAGLRDDPFFFNLDGFKTVASFVKQNKGTLPFDTNGCPKLDQNTVDTAVTALKTGGDTFKPNNVLAIVVAVDKALVTKGGPLLGVWASTNR